MDDVKPFQHCFEQDLKTTELVDFPIKTGEILRHNRGKYSFMCFHCGFIIEDFAEIIDHCDSHYQDYQETFNDAEFVLCTETDVETKTAFVLTPEIDAKAEVITRQPDVTETRTSSTILIKSKPTPASSVRKQDKRKWQRWSHLTQNCEVCGAWSDSIRNHLEQVHGITHLGQRSRIFQCYVCKSAAKNGTELKRHMFVVHQRGKSGCYQCEAEPPIVIPSDPRRHKCFYCKEWFRNHVEFKIHFMDVHDKDADTFFRKPKNFNIYTCYVCEKEFQLRDKLYQHLKIHDDKYLRHTCPTCGKRWRTFGLLTQHMKKHDGKIYSCDLCDKQFANYVRLNLHRKCHNTELKYTCPHCPKAFTQRKYLMVHKVVHDEVKRYQCKFCDARFNFTSGRRAHEKSQHNVL